MSYEALQYARDPLRGRAIVREAAMADHASETTALVAEVRELLRRAVRTLAALPDPDGRFLAARTTWWPEVVRDVHEAYGYAPPRVRRFAPTPHDVQVYLDVLSWLAWLRRAEGMVAVRRIWSWAIGVPAWKIASREGCSERTVMNRIDRSISAILCEFAGEKVQIEKVEEPCALRPYALSFAAPVAANAEAGSITSFGKVWVHNEGFMRNGRPVRDGRERVNQRKLYVNRSR